MGQVLYGIEQLILKYRLWVWAENRQFKINSRERTLVRDKLMTEKEAGSDISDKFVQRGNGQCVLK